MALSVKDTLAIVGTILGVIFVYSLLLPNVMVYSMGFGVPSDLFTQAGILLVAVLVLLVLLVASAIHDRFLSPPRVYW